jgi:curved DNA-binding protein CbpA
MNQLIHKNNSNNFNNYNNHYKSFQNELIKLGKNKNFKPHDVLNIKPNASITEIKQAYKKAALYFHPDRPTGNTETFKLVTQAFLTLLHQNKNNSGGNGNSDDIWQSFNGQFIRKNPISNMYDDPKDFNNNGYQSIPSSFVKGKDFNNKLFNQLFDKHRLNDQYDKGYGDQMIKSEYNGNRSNLSYQPNLNTEINEHRSENRNGLFSDNFNLNIFNNVFEKELKSRKNEITKVHTPTPVVFQQQLGFSNLGQGKIKDFGGKTDSGVLEFTDYLNAYSDLAKISYGAESNRQSFNTIEDLKRDRLNTQMSTSDKSMYMKNEKLKELEEKKRINRLTRYDQYANKNFQNFQNHLKSNNVYNLN